MGKKKGAKGLYCPEIVEAILSAIRNGSSEQHAAQAVGVGVSTIGDWKNRHPAFLEAIKGARSKKIDFCLQHIIRIAIETNQWAAFAWILERTEPSLFGKRVEVRHGEVDLSPADRIERMRALLGINPNSSKLTVTVAPLEPDPEPPTPPVPPSNAS